MLWHFISQVLGVMIGWRYYQRNSVHNPIPISDTHNIIILSTGILGAFIGSRLLAIWQDLAFFHQHPNLYIYLASNKTIVGALLGGLIFVEICKSILGVNRSTGDNLTYPLMVAMMIGRIGCFLYGLPDHTVGLPTHMPWGIDFGDGVPRHPTSLYEILFLAILFIFLKTTDKKTSNYDGLRFKLFLSGYLCYRLAVGFIEPGYQWLWQMTAIQLACISGLCYYITLLLLSVSTNKSLINHEK